MIAVLPLSNTELLVVLAAMSFLHVVTGIYMLGHVVQHRKERR